MKKVFEFLIDENESESGVKTISLVENPAMQSKFIAFNSQIQKGKYIKLGDGEGYKNIVAGLSMIPDKMIYRIDEETGEEYMGYFSSNTIEKMRNKYHKEMMTSNVNTDHNENGYIDAYLVESYILNSEERVNEVKSQGIEDAVLGSWYTQFKIEDDRIFNEVLEGKYKGFSIEAYLDRMMKVAMSVNKNNFIQNNENMNKTFIEKLKEKFNNMLESLTEKENFESALVPVEGFTINWTEVGMEVTKTYQNNDEEITEPVGAGEFVIEDGRTLLVDENSNLTEVRDAVMEENMETENNAETVVENTVSDFDKKLGDLIDLTKNGQYMIEVMVADGKMEYGQISSMTEIKMKSDFESEIDTLKKGFDTERQTLEAEITSLKEKLSESIAEPVLTDKENSNDVNVEKTLSHYEKIINRRNLPKV